MKQKLRGHHAQSLLIFVREPHMVRSVHGPTAAAVRGVMKGRQFATLCRYCTLPVGRNFMLQIPEYGGCQVHERTDDCAGSEVGRRASQFGRPSREDLTK